MEDYNHIVTLTFIPLNSYFHILYSINKKTRLPVLQLGYLVNNEISVNIPNNIIILRPGDYKNNNDYFTNLYKESYYEYDGDIKKLLYKLINIFKVISGKSDQVSDTCHVGISTF